MHLGASQETIKEDANRQARIWKAKKNVGSPKIHTNKLKDYIDVWDRIEGWNGAGYDTNREETLKQIASSTKRSLSTLHSQFKAAFEAIIGHEFSPSLWWKTMGRMKLDIFSGSPNESIEWSARRRFNQHQDRLVTETTLSGSHKAQSSGNLIQNSSNKNGDIDSLDFVDAIVQQIEAGLTDAQIIEKMNLTQHRSEEMLQMVRTKQIDLRTLAR